MKRLTFCFLYLFPLLIYAQSSETGQETLNRNPNNSNNIEINKSDSVNSTTSYLGLFIDPKLTMISGAENILFFHYVASRTEDKLIGTRWSSENGFLKKGGGVLGRFSKYLLIDSPMDFFLILINHEYFGHGSRYREFDLGKVEYHFNLPPIYGPGGGYAHISSNSRQISDHELLGIWQGGLESHDLISKRLNLRWVTKKQSYYHEAILYFWTWQDRFQYIQSTINELPTKYDGSLYDPEGYIWILNRHAGYKDPKNFLMGVSDLKKKNLVNLANPFVWYSLFVQMKTYIYDGKTMAKLPMIRFGGIEYLPSMRMSLTPFGPQYHLENYLRTKNKVSLIDIRIGDQTFYKDWWGGGILVQNIYEKKRFSLNLSFDAWKQPKLEIRGNSITSKDGGWGAAFSLRGYYNFKISQNLISAIAELGYKTSGFLQGYALDSSPILMFGFGIRN